MRLYLDSCVLIDALDGAEPLRSHTLQQLERFADSDWVISDPVRMEYLVWPSRIALGVRRRLDRRDRATT
jgi:predicted nucleic acid-binding protein